MARISRLFFCFFLSFCIPFLHAQDDPLYIPSDQVTFEYLASSPWTNHVIFFEKIFKKVRPTLLLEFGLGNSTKYFLDNALQVISIELNAECTAIQTETWFNITKQKFSSYANWLPILHNCSKQMSELTQTAWKQIPINSLPKTYFDEINALCDFSLVLCRHDCSLAFVDSALFGRAYIVCELLRRHVPIVAAHDTDLGINFYQWDRIVTPDEYVLINFKGPDTNQLSVWFLKGILSEQDILELQSASS